MIILITACAIVFIEHRKVRKGWARHERHCSAMGVKNCCKNVMNHVDKHTIFVKEVINETTERTLSNCQSSDVYDYTTGIRGKSDTGTEGRNRLYTYSGIPWRKAHCVF
jgi:hypothetical protein